MNRTDIKQPVSCPIASFPFYVPTDTFTIHCIRVLACFFEFLAACNIAAMWAFETVIFIIRPEKFFCFLQPFISCVFLHLINSSFISCGTVVLPWDTCPTGKAVDFLGLSGPCGTVGQFRAFSYKGENISFLLIYKSLYIYMYTVSHMSHSPTNPDSPRAARVFLWDYFGKSSHECPSKRQLIVGIQRFNLHTQCDALCQNAGNPFALRVVPAPREYQIV